jgi:peptidyl-prolyl cis-trans isomerase B (cyclophilin B)
MAKVQLKTSMGNITLSLDEELAPKSTENFLEYVRSGHYDGTIFHRVIANFMVQGGGMTAGMARTSDPHSATAQFFINVVDNAFLNFSAPTPQGWGYAVFGEVSEGMDVVDAIRQVKTGSSGFHQDVPKEDVTIISATILEE